MDMKRATCAALLILFVHSALHNTSTAFIPADFDKKPVAQVLPEIVVSPQPFPVADITFINPLVFLWYGFPTSGVTVQTINVTEVNCSVIDVIPSTQDVVVLPGGSIATIG